MDIYDSPDNRKIKHPAGIVNGHVDTAVAHWGAEIIMPIRAVNAIALIEIHHIRGRWRDSSRAQTYRRSEVFT